MTEVLFIAGLILIFQYSFIYRNIAILAAGATVFLASTIDANLYVILGAVLILSVIRISKAGAEDRY